MPQIPKSLMLALAQRLEGPIYTPDDENYASEIAGFNTAVTHAPAIVVCATCQTDILETVHFAKLHGYPVKVQATGHGALDPMTTGILISTRRMDQVIIHSETQTAIIQAGVKWKSVIEAAAPHGLVPIVGSSVDVGVVGYLLGGGLGPLARSHGFSSDYLIEMTVVTGAGELLRTSESENSELFWALRGGKVGLGIVTEVRLRLVKLQTLYAGSLTFEEKDMEVALRTWATWTSETNPIITTSVAIVHFPEIPVIPEKFRGRRLLSIRFAYPGSIEEGTLLAAPLRACAPVYVDALGELAASDVGRIHNDPSNPMPFWACGVLLTHIDQDFVTHILNEFGAGRNPLLTVVEIRHIGGAASFDVKSGSAVGGRSAEFVCSFVGKNPKQFEALFSSKAEELINILQTWISKEGNINLMGKSIAGKHFKYLWPENILNRLQQVQQSYNPARIL